MRLGLFAHLLHAIAELFIGRHNTSSVMVTPDNRRRPGGSTSHKEWQRCAQPFPFQISCAYPTSGAYHFPILFCEMIQRPVEQGQDLFGWTTKFGAQGRYDNGPVH